MSSRRNGPLCPVTIANSKAASEGIALKLRRNTPSRKYLYVQIFAGLAYVLASGFMLQLRRWKRRQAQLNSV
jgi:hypothetical protein